MKRVFVLCIATSLLVGAGLNGAFAAPPPSVLSRPLDLSFSLLPPPTKQPVIKSSTFAAAPVPNIDQDVPTLRALGPAQAELSPSLFNAKRGYRGEGFTAGSTSQSEMQRHFKPTPGVNLSVPLQ